MVNKLIRNGKVAVLYSPGFGAELGEFGTPPGEEPHELDSKPVYYELRDRRRLLNDFVPVWQDMYAHVNGRYGWSDLRAYSDETVRGILIDLLKHMTEAQFDEFVTRYVRHEARK